MWIEEGGWIEEEKGTMDIYRGFPLLEMLRLSMYSLENPESLEWYLFLLLLIPFIGLK